jgi:hypothetical protein
MKRTVRVGIYSERRFSRRVVRSRSRSRHGQRRPRCQPRAQGAGVVITVGETVGRARPSTLRDRWRRRHYRLHLPPRRYEPPPGAFAWANCLRRAASTIADGGVSIFRAYDGVDFRTTVPCSQADSGRSQQAARRGQERAANFRRLAFLSSDQSARPPLATNAS